MFDLHGLIEEGTALVGSIERDGSHVLITISLAEELSEREKKELKENLEAKIANPSIYANSDSFEKIGTLFTNSAANTLTVNLNTPDEAGQTIETVLKHTECPPRIIFMCADKKTYLTTCTELSLSRSDFFQFDELKVLLDDRKEQRRSVVGSCHKLVEAIRNQTIKLPPIPDLSFDKISGWEKGISGAQKFYLGDTDDACLKVQDNQGEPMNLFYPGNLRLPYDECLFEFKASPISKFGDKQFTTYLMAFESRESRGKYYGFLFDRNPYDNAYYFLGFGPNWHYDSNGCPSF